MRRGLDRMSGSALALGLLVLCLPGPARAQAPAMDAQHFQPHADRTGFYTTWSSDTLELWQPAFGAWFNYARDPVVYYVDGDPLYRVVGDLATLDLQAAIGFGPVDLSVDVPLHLAVKGSGLPSWDEGVSGGAMGDIRVVPKVRLMDADKRGLGLAIVLPLSFPSGEEGRYVGLRTVSFSPTLAASGRVGRFHVGANLGWMIAGAEPVDDLVAGQSFLFRVAGAYSPHDVVTIGAELFGNVHSQPRNNPVEWLLGATVRPAPGLGITVGGGTAMGRGIGAPVGRLMFGVGWTRTDPKDTDGDGIIDRKDECPTDPEDIDQFWDHDGCPDPDNDSDGILDVSDTCPDDPETFNDWQDIDGCPDAIPDTDGDGLLDNVDGCPNDPEDPDGFEDEDGCPDVDNDQDRILDINDACPLEPEVYNNVDDDDGCPDEGRVVVAREEIVILDKVHFDTNKAVIQKKSLPLLNDVAAALKRFDNIRRVEVQGHTDERGSDSYNERLSQARAEAVLAYLVSQGVDGSRLEAKGYGEAQPLDPASNEQAREMNRRVQFVILQQD